jgi:hypothetical protein
MNRFVLVLIAGLLVSMAGSAQPKKSSTEFGVSIGSSSFFGDLGGSKDIGRAFLYDLDLAATRPVVGVIFRQNMGRRMAFRLNGYFGLIWGDDSYANTTLQPGDPAWSRKYRNLAFKSHIAEFSTILEYHFMPYQAGSLRYRFTPYLCGGVGLCNFNPKAYYPGDALGNPAGWYALRNYSTEGQGFAQFPEKQKYSTIAVAFPLGGGLKYNLSKKYGLSLEVAHRLTTSDYIDDVSTSYIDPALYYANLPVEQAIVSEYFGDRSSGDYPIKTAPGQQRGDPSDADGYTFTGVLTLTYTVSYSSKQFFCPTFPFGK